MRYPQSMQRDRLSYLLIPFVTLLAILPLILNGCSCGHDFDFHLLNWMEAARQFTHGNLHPHWAYTAAYNAGEPRFVFYPPASWTIGAILGLVLPWAWTPIAYTWLALTASGFAMHRLARAFAGPAAALLASVVYAVNPYMLFTAYERTAYAELLAAAWMPLLLHAILRRRITIPSVAIPVALLWLTNAPAAVMSCYALALLATVRLATNPGTPYLDSEMWASRDGATAPADLPAVQQSRIHQARNTIAGTALGLGLAAFYILPAAWERRFVQIAMALIPGMRIDDNFLFHHTGDAPHDQVLHTASVIALILIAATALALILFRLTAKPQVNYPPQRVAQRLFFPLASLTVVITLLLTPITAFIWKHAPELTFLQFPWRLLAILAAVLSLAIAIVLTSFHRKPVVTAALAICIAASLTYPAYTAFHQFCDPEDEVSTQVAVFHSSQGSEPTDEYTPTSADNDSLAQANPPFWLSPNPDAKAPAKLPAETQPGPAPTHLSLNSPIPQTLILNLRDYPSWRITLNGTSVVQHKDNQRDDGLIALSIPAGPSTISIAYSQTVDQTLGDAISLISLALLLLTIRKRKIA